MAMWKRQYISKGWRATLIKSMLSSSPIYFMSIFQVPRLVRLRLEQIQRYFLWGGGCLEKKNSPSALSNNALKQVGWRIGSEGFGLLE